jgi:hypothetical protein
VGETLGLREGDGVTVGRGVAVGDGLVLGNAEGVGVRVVVVGVSFVDGMGVTVSTSGDVNAR